MTKEKNLVFIALFAALIAVLGLIPSVPMPWGIPMTAQSLGVMIAGTVLGAKRGALSVGLFILLVALGLPLLSGGRGGLGVFQGPTVGFIIGFPIAALVAGWIVEKVKVDIMIASALGAFVGGIVVLYAFGIVGFSIIMGRSLWDSTVVMGLYIPGDLIKIIITAIVTQAIWKASPDKVMSRS